MGSTTIWNSISIQQALDKLRMGIQTDLSAFHMGDIELKAGELLYQLTAEEIDEFHKCSLDIVYFVEKYCRFLTDLGRKPVKLRDYQKRILRNLAAENYSEVFKDLIPENRNIIVMASRQTGKCLFNSHIYVQYPNGIQYKIPISLFYYMSKGKLTLLEKIKVKLLIWYNILNLEKS